MKLKPGKAYSLGRLGVRDFAMSFFSTLAGREHQRPEMDETQRAQRTQRE